MAQTMNRLTPWQVQALTKVGRHADGGNLFLVVRPSGARSWVFLFRWHGKPTEAGGGPCSSVSLKQARAWAAEGRAMLHENPPRNPKVVWKQLREATQVPTFAQMAEQYLDGKPRQWRSRRHRAQVHALLHRDCKPIANRPVNEIDTGDVLLVLKAVLKRAPSLAARLRGCVEQVLAAAQALGHIDPNQRNPASWRGHLDQLLPARFPAEHYPALPYSELPDFMAELRAQRRTVDGAYCLEAFALEFSILCAARPGEACGARWSEIDLPQRLWTVPAARMKSHRPHQVPLSDGAVEVLSALQGLRCSEFVFSADGRKPIVTKRFERLLQRLQRPCTAHGFRSAFRDWAGNETSHSREVCEAALAHIVGNETERAYRRSRPLAKHRALLQAWDNYLAARPAEIIALRA